jgi:MoCo/4Fe-4S cofactor protein with predicted Tat translocation signal
MENKNTYWKGLEELNETTDFVESRDNEFHQELPVDEFLGDDKLREASTGRRDFLKFLGFSVAAASLAACETPVIKSVPYVNKPEDITPGVANWYASTYYDGNDYASILVKTREGRPIHIKGNRSYGITKGGITPRINASVLTVYDSQRLKNPVADGNIVEWSQIDGEITNRLNGIASSSTPGKIRILSNSIISPSTQSVIDDFVAYYSGKPKPAYDIPTDGGDEIAAAIPVAVDTAAADTATVIDTPVAEATPEVNNNHSDVKHVTYDPISYSGIRAANKKNFGKAIIPDYDFSKAKVIVSISADFLSNWLLSTEYMMQYISRRRPETHKSNAEDHFPEELKKNLEEFEYWKNNIEKRIDNENKLVARNQGGGDGWMSRHFQFESIMSLSGSNADVRGPIKPSEQGVVAAAILAEMGQDTGVDTSGLSKDVMKKVKAAAEELQANKSESLVVSGSNDPSVQMLVNAINQKLGNYESTLNLNNELSIGKSSDTEVKDMLSELKAGDALIIYGVNPAYSYPDSKALNAVLDNKDILKISMAGYMDETASKCDYVCPDHHFLEAWNDFNPKTSHYAIAQPTIRPLHKTAAAQESLLVWAGAAKRGGKDSTVFHDYIKNNWELYGYPMAKAYFSTFHDYWNTMVGNSAADVPAKAATAWPFTDATSDAANGVKAIVDGAKGDELVLYQKGGIGDGSQANNPWLQEMPDPITKVTWDNYITMSPADMKKGGYNTYIGQKSPATVGKVKVGGKTIELPVYPQPGQKQGTIGIALGYGRGANGESIGRAAFQTGEFGEYLKEKGKKQTIGKNAFALASVADNGSIGYDLYDVSVKKTSKEYFMATTQTHHTVMGRNTVIKETTKENYDKHDPWGEDHHGKHEYNKPYHLAMHGPHIDPKTGKETHGPNKMLGKDVTLWAEHPVEKIGHRWGLAIDLSTCIGCSACVTACMSENNVPVVGKDEVARVRDMHWMRIDRYYKAAQEEMIGKKKEDFTYGELEVPEDNPKVVFQPVMCQHCNHAPCETVCPVIATSHSSEGLNMMTYNRCIGTRYCANNCPYKVRRFNWFNYQAYRKFDKQNPAQQDMGRMVLNPDVVVRSRGVMEKCSMCVQNIQAGKLQAKMEQRKVKDGEIQTACSSACALGAITFGDLNDMYEKDKDGNVISEGSGIHLIASGERSYNLLDDVGTQPNIYYLAKVRNEKTAGGKKESGEAHH